MEATLQNVFRLCFDRYREHHGMSVDQYQAANAIMACRCLELGQCAVEAQIGRVVRDLAY